MKFFCSHAPPSTTNLARLPLQEGGPDTSQETLLRNMADGGDGHRRFSLEDEEELAEIEAAEAAPEEEEEAPAPQSRGELEAKVLEIAAELESLGKVSHGPTAGWGAGGGQRTDAFMLGFALAWGRET